MAKSCGKLPSSSTRTRAEDLGGGRCESAFREFENGDRVLTRYAGELLEEHVERVAGLEVVNQPLHGHAGPGEHGGTTESIGRGSDEWVRKRHIEVGTGQLKSTESASGAPNAPAKLRASQ